MEKTLINRLVFIGFTLTILSCSNKKNDNAIGYRYLELFRYCYNVKNNDSFNDNIVRQLNKTFLNKNQPDWYQTTILVDEYNKTVDWSIVKEPYPLPEGSLLNLTISIYDGSIYVDKNLIQVSDVRNIVKNHIHNSRIDKKHNVVKKTEYFGDVVFPKTSIVLKVNRNRSFISKNEWLLMFNCFDACIQLIDEKKNEISMNKWRTSYSCLPFSKQIAVAKLAHINVTIVFPEN